MNRIKEVLAYIGFFFLLGAPGLIGLTVALVTGETSVALSNFKQSLSQRQQEIKKE